MKNDESFPALDNQFEDEEDVVHDEEEDVAHGEEEDEMRPNGEISN